MYWKAEQSGQKTTVFGRFFGNLLGFEQNLIIIFSEMSIYFAENNYIFGRKYGNDWDKKNVHLTDNTFLMVILSS